MKIILLEDGSWYNVDDMREPVKESYKVINLGGGDWTDREISSMIQEYYETFPFD